MVDDGEIEKVVIESERYAITPKKDEEQENPLLGKIQVTYYTGIMEDDALLGRLEKADVDVSKKIPDTASALFWNFMLTVILPFGLIFIFMSLMMKKNLI
jgi:cell division protease FtsH